MRARSVATAAVTGIAGQMKAADAFYRHDVARRQPGDSRLQRRLAVQRFPSARHSSRGPQSGQATGWA